eukprot:NODE_26_length_40862_cov_0.679513.p2 type:complete len:1048 gc:universal NODE_26_length_40862_cov_0.679513:21467-18324(-)
MVRSTDVINLADNLNTNETIEFRQGQIMNIELEKFLTYEHVVFRCHPNLNLLCGPNGSGKSSIVCAIVLGLGGKPANLERSSDLKSFIKFGEDFAKIHITIKTQSGSTTISRFITTKSNDFLIDNVKCNLKVIDELMADLNINVANLCQVLPQERVGQFAALNAKDRLKETEYIVGGNDFRELHEQVIADMSNSNNAAQVLEERRQELESLIQRNQLVIGQVETYRESELLKLELEALTAVYKLLNYEEARATLNTLKDDREKASRTLNSTRKKNEANAKRKRVLQEKVDQASDAVSLLEKNVSVIQKRLTQGYDKSEEIEEEITNVFVEINKVHEKEKEDKDSIEAQKRAISSLTESIKSEESKFADYKEQETRLKENLQKHDGDGQDLEQKLSTINSKVRDLDSDARLFRQRQSDAERELKQLNEVKTQRLNILRNLNSDAFTAYQYVTENHHKFSNVEGPVFLDIEVQAEYRKAVENFVGRGLFSILTDNVADYEHLMKELIDSRALKIDVRHPPNSNFENDANYKSVGFDAVLADAVQCTPLVKSFLCNDFDFHKIPVSSRALIPSMYDKCRGVYPKFVMGNEIHINTRSRYGRKELSTKTSILREARVLKNATDTQRVEELKNVITDSRTKVDSYAKELHALKTEENKINSQMKKRQEARSSLATQLQSVRQKLMIPANLRSKLSSYEESLQVLENRPSIDSQIKRKEKIIESKEEDKRNLVEEYIKEFEGLENLVEKLYLKCQLVSTSRRDLQEFLNDYSDTSSTINSLENSVKLLEREIRSAEKNVEEFNTEQKNQFARLSVAAKSMIEEREFKNLEIVDVGMQIRGLETRLNNTLNETVREEVRLYEERKLQITKLEKLIAVKEREAEELTSLNVSRRRNFISKVNNMITDLSSKFRENMLSVKCDGEIKLYKSEDPEDIKHWGIDILVKFRGAESLHSLSGTRHSGGEKSVATMLYLMCLQGTSSVPFRVVDEINQGMDPRNEKLVHALVVQRSKDSQYFMITPKLLKGLDYSYEMAVHLVCQGDRIPEQLDFQRYLR